MTRFRDRSTADMAVLALVGLIIVVVLIAALSVAIIEITSEGEADTKSTVDLIANAVKVLIGAVVGYVAGRSTNHQPPSGNQDT